MLNFDATYASLRSDDWHLHSARCNQLPELSGKKMNATNASPEPSPKHAKIIILLEKNRPFSLESQSFLSLVYTRFLPLKLKRYSAGFGSDSEF